MLDKMNKVVTAVERLNWIWSLVPSSGVSLVTGWLGYLGDMPLMYIWVSMVVTFAFVIWAIHCIQTPTGKSGIAATPSPKNRACGFPSTRLKPL